MSTLILLVDLEERDCNRMQFGVLAAGNAANCSPKSSGFSSRARYQSWNQIELG